MSRSWKYRGGAIVAAVLMVGVVCLGGVAPGLGAASAASGRTAAATSPAMFNRETYNFTTALSIAQEARRYQVMVLQSTDSAKVGPLHAANPGLRILMYLHSMLSRTTVPPATATCTDYQADLSAHPSWFLRDQSGNVIQRHGYPGSYLMDVGNSAYQQACIGQAVSMAKQYGFDGVYFDGFEAELQWALPWGTQCPEYPTYAAWQAAEYGFITQAASSAHARGLLIVGNIGGSSVLPTLWQQWTAPMDGSEEESWTDDGSGLANWLKLWSKNLAHIAWSEANGKYALLHSWNQTQAGNAFGLASMLLVANGRASYSTSDANYTSGETWYPEYTTAQQLGAPAAAYQQLPNGVYERVFTNGIVLVNASTNSLWGVAVGGSYSGSGYSNTGTVSIGPASGLIMTGHGATLNGPPVGTTAKPKPKAKAKPKARCVVPKLAHLSLTSAKRVLSRAHCRVGKVSRKRSSRRNGSRVVAQSPGAHRRLTYAARVNLTLGR